jgi:hypothetical protein
MKHTFEEPVEAYEILKLSCDSFVDYLASEDSNPDADDDWINDIFEKAMALCCGDDIFDEVRRLMDERDEVNNDQNRRR